MMVEKFSKYNRDKLVNTIIETRKEILEALRLKSDNLDREVYNKAERKIIKQEIREIAEMVSMKDVFIKNLKQLDRIKKIGDNTPFSTVYRTRRDAINILHDIRNDIIATQYDEEELAIVEQELNDVELMITDKDRLVVGKARQELLIEASPAELKRMNPHLGRFFKMDIDPNID